MQNASAALIISIVAVVLGGVGLIGGVLGYVQGTNALRRATHARQRAVTAEEEAVRARADAEAVLRQAEEQFERDRQAAVRAATGPVPTTSGPVPSAAPRQRPVPPRLPEATTGSMLLPETTGPTAPPSGSTRLPAVPPAEHQEAARFTVPVAPAVPQAAEPLVTEPPVAEAPAVEGPVAEGPSTDAGRAPTSSAPPASVQQAQIVASRVEPAAATEARAEAAPEAQPEPEPEPEPVAADGDAPPAEDDEAARDARGRVPAGAQDAPPMDWAEVLRTGAIPLPSISRGTYAAPRRRPKPTGQGPARFELRAIGRQRFEAVNVGGEPAEDARIEGAGDDPHLVRPLSSRPAPVPPGGTLSFSVLRVEGRSAAAQAVWTAGDGTVRQDLPLE